MFERSGVGHHRDGSTDGNPGGEEGDFSGALAGFQVREVSRRRRLEPQFAQLPVGAAPFPDVGELIGPAWAQGQGVGA